MNRLLPFILLLLTGTRIFSQQLSEANFDHFTTASGLSHNTITGIKQDHTGYIWIGTTSGLNRFNGNRFVQFHSNDDSLSMASEVVHGMSCTGKDRLAIHSTGVHVVNTKTGGTRNLFIPYHNLQYQFKFNMIERTMGDEEGNLYALTRSGFYHFDSNSILVSRFDYYNEAAVPVSHFYFGRELLQLDEDRLLILSINGLYVYEKRKKKIKKFEASDCALLAEFVNYPPNNYTILQPGPGEFFILKSLTDSLVYVSVPGQKKFVSRIQINPLKNEFAYRSRMVKVNDTLFYLSGHIAGFHKLRFYPQTGEVKIDDHKYFPAYLCNTLFVDKDKHLWIATNKGVFRENPQRALVQLAAMPAAIEDSFPNVRIDDVCVTAGKVYAATRSMGGVIEFDKKTLRFNRQIRFTKYDGKGNNIPAAIVLDSGRLMLGTDGPLLIFDPIRKVEVKLVPPKWADRYWTNDLFKDRRGNVWIGSYEIYRYKPSSNQFSIIRNHQSLLRVPVMMQEDTAGNIWLAGHGLARYNVAMDTIDLVLDSFPYIKLPDKQVNALVIDQHNTIWFNCANNGLTSYDIKTRRFRHFTRKDGLPDDNMASLIIVGHHLWMACWSGLACMDLRTFQIVNFGKEDGLPELPVVRGARFSYDAAERQLYLGLSTMVMRFNPETILRKKSPPEVFIESVTLSDKKLFFLPTGVITTSWKENEIRITIGAINFSDGNSQRFAYRIMKDTNSKWVQIGSQPSFSISNLSPGTHRIQVKCFSPSDRWTEQVKEMSIKVLPPVWGRDWFKLLMVGVGFLLIYMLVQWRTELARKKEMVKTHIEKLKADDYKNQFELEQITNYFSSSMAGKKTEDEVLWDVTNNLIARMNYVDCMIYLWNPAKTKMVQRAAFGPKGKPELLNGHVFDVLPGQGIVGHVIASGQPVLVPDTRIDSRYRVDEQARLSEVCVPIIHNDELLGAIDSEHHKPNYFSERDIKILTTIATLIGNKLKQLESERSLDAKRRELATINEQLAEARLSALQAQMNPHFVFNALNSIKRMILDADNEKASRYLSKFALMIRMTLNHSKDIFVTLDENIDYLRAYLEMEQLRFDESFTYFISTDKNLDSSETTIPSMMMQPLVENAIWHGLMQSVTDKKIMISFTQRGNRITCTVEDNGIGIRESEKLKQASKSPHQSVGLGNLKNRIKIMNEKYDMDCRLCIIDLAAVGKGKGTRVVLDFNLINA